jgi:N-acyl-L-homoserine lactone synthetase
MLLYKGLYQWCIKNDKRHLYAVTEMKIYKLLCSIGFPCKLIGDLSKMPDGIVAVAFIIDLREWETIQITKRPKMLKWFSSTEAHPDAQENEKGTNCVYRIRQHARQHK